MSEEQANPCRPATPGPVLGKALVKGLCNNQHLQWEVSFELEPPALQRDDTQDADMWSETFHHLAARAIIRDFEQLAEREDDIELGEPPGLGIAVIPLAIQCPSHCPRTAPSLSKVLPTLQDPTSSSLVPHLLLKILSPIFKVPSTFQSPHGPYSDFPVTQG